MKNLPTFARVLTLTQRVNPHSARQFHNQVLASTGGLLQSESAVRLARKQIWLAGYTPFSNAVTVRNVSYIRILPKILLKFARIPALFGGATIAGLAYLQYQATLAGNYALDVLDKTKNVITGIAEELFVGAKNIADSTRKGWENTKDQSELPEWMQRVLRIHEDVLYGGNSEGPKREPPKKGESGATTIIGASAAYGHAQSDEEESKYKDQDIQVDQMMVLTKKMIEIRSILQTLDKPNTLKLPSIVVIGSQSSGKSSVLEALVGHEFLPKGLNMVTRRPIELTLVNTPETQDEYGEFPALGLGKIKDFFHIQRTLTELNLAVPDSQCVSDDPIQLTISSPHVPDLSLIDLPGYIQVVGHDQPIELKQRISDLCDKYIQPPNIILAISAADVDLANSAALRASRRVDPRGERTIGVITKMDLVDEERGAALLTDKKYPLRLGYVGVVSKIPNQTSSLFRKDRNIAASVARNEQAFFSSHPQKFTDGIGISVGTKTLRRKLMQVLEQTMAASLLSTENSIRQELEEATYEFKVQYNDRPLSAESYLAESLDMFKHSFKEFTETFGRLQVRELLKDELDQKVLDLLAAKYWNKPITTLQPPMLEPDTLSNLPNAEPDSLYWHHKLDSTTSTLTKLGIGRLATNVVANALRSHVDRLISQSSFALHPFARQTITEAASSILNERFYSTSDQVENCIKPYKFEIDVEDNDWVSGRESICKVLEKELKACEEAVKNVEADIGGRRKVKDVMNFVVKARKDDGEVLGDVASGAGGFSNALLEKAKHALFLHERASLLRMRLRALRSKQCSSKTSRYYCPEIFLDVVASKLTSTAVLFLNVELLSEFYYNFPRILDIRLGRGLSKNQIELFANEDPRVRGHLEVIRRKELLELALQKMEGLKELEVEERGKRVASSRELDKLRSNNEKIKGKGWGIF